MDVQLLATQTTCSFLGRSCIRKLEISKVTCKGASLSRNAVASQRVCPEIPSKDLGLFTRFIQQRLLTFYSNSFSSSNTLQCAVVSHFSLLMSSGRLRPASDDEVEHLFSSYKWFVFPAIFWIDAVPSCLSNLTFMMLCGVDLIHVICQFRAFRSLRFLSSFVFVCAWSERNVEKSQSHAFNLYIFRDNYIIRILIIAVFSVSEYVVFIFIFNVYHIRLFILSFIIIFAIIIIIIVLLILIKNKYVYRFRGFLFLVDLIN